MVELTVKQSGTAVANSVYIGTTQAPIQEAINYAGTQGGGTIFIEKGTYDIVTSINVGSNIKVHGEFSGTKLESRIQPNSDTGAIFKCIGTAAAPLANITIEALQIGTTFWPVVQSGIYCNYVGKAQTTGLPNGGYDSSTVGRDKENKRGITVKDCIIGQFSSSINLRVVSNCVFSGNVIEGGLLMSINGDSNSNNYNTIIGNTFQKSNCGIRLYAHASLASCSNSNNCNIIAGNFFPNCDIGIELSTYSSTGNNIATCTNNYNTIVGNAFQNHYKNGVILYCDDGYQGPTHIGNSNNYNTIIGNTFRNIGEGYGLQLKAEGNAISRNFNNYNTITANTFRNCNVGNINLFAFFSESPDVCGYNTITGNVGNIRLDTTPERYSQVGNNTITGNIGVFNNYSGGLGNAYSTLHNQIGT